MGRTAPKFTEIQYSKESHVYHPRCQMQVTYAAILPAMWTLIYA